MPTRRAAAAFFPASSSASFAPAATAAASASAASCRIALAVAAASRAAACAVLTCCSRACLGWSHRVLRAQRQEELGSQGMQYR